MGRIDQGQEAIDKIDPKVLKEVQIGDIVKSKTLSGSTVIFKVSRISPGSRGYCVYLRTTEGFEWGIRKIKWKSQPNLTH